MKKLIFSFSGLLFLPLYFLIFQPFIGIGINQLYFSIILSFIIIIIFWNFETPIKLTNYILNKLPFIKYYWNGNGKLWIIFWVYGMPVTLIIFFITRVLFERMSLYSIFLYFILIVISNFWWSVSCWKCSKNSRNIWQYLTKIYIVLMWINLALILFGGFSIFNGRI